MLFVTRKIGESVTVTGLRGNTRELKVSVLAIQDGLVRLGFETETEVADTRATAWELEDTVEAPEVSRPVNGTLRH